MNYKILGGINISSTSSLKSVQGNKGKKEIAEKNLEPQGHRLPKDLWFSRVHFFSVSVQAGTRD